MEYKGVFFSLMTINQLIAILFITVPAVAWVVSVLCGEVSGGDVVHQNVVVVQWEMFRTEDVGIFLAYSLQLGLSSLFSWFKKSYTIDFNSLWFLQMILKGGYALFWNLFRALVIFWAPVLAIVISHHWLGVKLCLCERGGFHCTWLEGFKWTYSKVFG